MGAEHTGWSQFDVSSYAYASNMQAALCLQASLQAATPTDRELFKLQPVHCFAAYLHFSVPLLKEKLPAGQMLQASVGLSPPPKPL
jgi:hypothetical protein